MRFRRLHFNYLTSRWLANTFCYALLILLVLLAAYVALGRLSFPAISQFKPDLEVLLSKNLSSPVQIEGLTGKWHGLNPVVAVESLSFQDRTNRVHKLHSLTIEFSFIDSLLSAGMKIKAFRFSGLHLHIKQEADGRWIWPWITGEFDQFVGDTIDPEELFRRYLVHPFVEITDSSVTVESSRGDFYTWQMPLAQLAFRNRRFTVSGHILSSGEDESYSQFAVEGELASDISPFQAGLYLGWDSGRFFNEYLDSYLWQGVKVDNLTTSGQLWMTISNGSVTDVRSIVDVPHVQLKVAEALLEPIEALHFDIQWSRARHRNIVKVSDFGFRWNGNVWQPSQGLLSIEDTGYRASLSYLNVTVLSRLLVDSQILGQDDTATLKGFSPQGELNHIQLVLPAESGNSETPLPPDARSAFRFEAELAGVSMRAYASKPLVENINGYIEMTEHGGEVIIDSDNFILGFPEIFLTPWQVRYADASLYWHIDSNDVLHLGSKGIKLGFSEESYVSGDFNFRSMLPGVGTENWLSLVISPHNIPASMTSDLVPFHRVDASLYHWLEQALVSGTLVDGIYVGHGLVGGDDPSDLFLSGMYFEVDAAEVNFADSWPSLEKTTGQVTLTENGLDIQLSQAEMNRVPFTHVSVSQTYSKDKTEHPLTVHFHSRVDGILAKHILTEFPFRNATGTFADAVEITGTSSLWGRVSVPLSRPDQSLVYLAVDLAGSTLSVAKTDLQFNDLRGMLYYNSEQGLSADEITMTLFDQPATLDISTANNGQRSHIQMNLHGNISVMTLSDWLGLPQNIGLSGETSFDAELSLLSERHKAGSRVKTRLDITSQLIGVEALLPQPFYKISPSAMGFRYSKFIGGYSRPDTFSLGEKVWGALSENPGSTTPSITVSLMTKEFEHSDEPGLHIKGKFDTLNLNPWLDYAERLKSEMANSELTDPGIPVATAQPASGLFRSANIQTEKLWLKGMTFSNLSTDIVISDENTWLVNLMGNEVLGSVSIPIVSDRTDTRPVIIRFERLSVAGRDSELPQEPAYRSIHEIPELDVEINQLSVAGDNWGRWLFKTQRRDSEIVVEPLAWQVQNSRFDGRLSWKQDATSGHQSTILVGKARLTDLLRTLRALGYDQPPFDAGSGHVDLALVWPRSPQDFDLKGLSGNIELTLSNGLIVDTAGSTDALKLLSILNLDTLSRRLRLDFSDLLEQGVSFDKLEAAANVQFGKLTLASPLVVQGPASAFKITGSTDLVTKALDMEMVMVLPLAKNLPLAAIVVGAPAVGGALWVIDNLLGKIGDPLSKLTSVTYSISGSWKRPDVRLKNVFDSSLSPAKSSTKRRPAMR
ncbi:MAG: TIGR02099 family protein [Gammaproteobacteria bacterium]|nr:MAG: TIGR02099 family protein [Gammaproteobacteria bacterium]